MINQIWDTVLMLSHLVYSSTMKGLCASQSFEPGSMERRHFAASFPATLNKIKQQPIEQTLADFRSYLLGACDTFNRAHFFMVVQAVVLVYYPSMALGIIFQEYQTEIAVQQAVAQQHVEDADEMEPEQDDEAAGEQREVMRSVDDVPFRYADMNATQLLQSMNDHQFNASINATITQLESMNSGQSVFARFMQMMQYIIEQMIKQSEQSSMTAMTMMQQPQSYDMKNEPQCQFVYQLFQQQQQMFVQEETRKTQNENGERVKIVIKLEISGVTRPEEIDRSQEVEEQVEADPRDQTRRAKAVVYQQMLIVF